MSVVPYRVSGEWPPFPAAQVKVGDLLGTRSVQVWSRIDTGAFMTAAPRELLEEIGAAASFRRISCRAYDGTVAEWPVYVIDLEIVDPRWPSEIERQFRLLNVLGIDRDSDVLLGRDVLAAWRLHLDGPQSRYSVE